MKRAPRAVFALLAALALAACSKGGGSGGAPAPVSSKPVLGILAYPRTSPTTTAQDVINAYTLASSSGVRGTDMGDMWSVLEPQAGVYGVSSYSAILTNPLVASYTAFAFEVQTINTTIKSTPQDLLAVPFDSPTMTARFHALIDAFAPVFADSRVPYIVVGNEVDVYLAQHPGEWATYTTFYDDAVAYIHQKLPGKKVCFSATFAGASGAQQANVAALAQASDVWDLTYYPLGANFTVLSPTSPATDLPRMVALAGGKPVILQEVGYPSAALLGSSEALQAQFVTSVFQSWQPLEAKIPFLCVFQLDDTAQATAQAYAQQQGMAANANFLAYVTSLGIRNADDTPKQGFAAFLAGVASLGLP